MNKKYIIGAVVVLVALWAGFTWGNKSVVAPEAPVANNGVDQTVTTTPVVKAPVVKVTTPVAPKTVVQSAPAMTKDGSYVVSYTSAGFSPKTLTIKLGKSVHFVNNSTKAMSVTTTTQQNQAQSELNQSKSVGQGGTYDFTFVTPGTWVYMNRNTPADYATIIVE